MLNLYLFQILNGLGLGMIYFLIAVGLTIIFGLLNFVNFAHGAFFLLGAYMIGRDILSRLIWGTRTVLFWSILATYDSSASTQPLK